RASAELTRPGGVVWLRVGGPGRPIPVAGRVGASPQIRAETDMVHPLLSRVPARPGDRRRSRSPGHRLRPVVEVCEVRLLLSVQNGGTNSPLSVSPASVVENPN